MRRAFIAWTGGDALAVRENEFSFSYQVRTSRFLGRVFDRAAARGARKRIPIDPSGAPCRNALATSDGHYLLPAGASAQLYVDAKGNAVARSDLVVINGDDVPLSESWPSRFEPSPLGEPVPVTALLDFVAVRVYGLQAADIEGGLSERLRAGDIYPTTYCGVRAGSERPAFLFANDAGCFLLVGRETGFASIGPDDLTSDDDYLDEEDAENWEDAW